MSALRALLAGEHRATAVLIGSFFVLLFLTLAVSETTEMVALQAGQVAPADIVAPRQAVNEPLYSQMKRKAAQAVQPVYVADTGAIPGAVQAIQSEIKSVQDAKASLAQNATTNDQVATWQTRVGLVLPSWAIQTILKASPQTLGDLGKTAQEIVKDVLTQASYRSSQVPNEESALDQQVAALALPDRAQTLFLEALLNQVARPNIVYSAAETLKARQRAEAAVAPPVIPAGTVIVAKGERLSLAEVSLLRSMGLDGGGFPWGPLAAALFLAALFSLATAAYVARFRTSLRGDLPRLLSLGILVILTVAAGRVLVGISPLLVPLAFLATVATTLLGSRVALFLTLTVGVLLTVVLNLGPETTAVLVGGSVAGVFATGHLRDRNDLLRAPLWIGAVNVLLVFTVEFLFTPAVTRTAPVWGDLLWALGSAALSSVMTIGFLPFFETYLGVLSPIRLLELSNPNQPLLRKLMLEAPGTYHHSLIVSNLAVAAAEEVGADSLLCRVGAYYHDIGKTLRPAFFVDNQMGGENPHDKIAPSLSALIIQSHVKDGLLMAEDARLPKEIRSFIGEHHGTTLISYFYHRALEQNPDGSVAEHDFRYPGPKPQTRETAILMLADGCEAAVRAVKGHTPQKIEGTVKKIIRDRLDDGQLDEARLTLKDLDTITKAFVRVLTGVYHARVEYPDPKDILERRQIDHGRVAKSSNHR